VATLGVAGGDRRVVEQAEAHGGEPFGVVARRPCGDEDVVGSAFEDIVDGGVGGADRGERRFPALRAHRGVGVDARHAGFRRHGLQARDVVLGVAVEQGRTIAKPGLDAIERGKTFVVEHAGDGAQAVGPLRMAWRRQMIEEHGMGVEAGDHAPI